MPTGMIPTDESVEFQIGGGGSGGGGGGGGGGVGSGGGGGVGGASTRIDNKRKAEVMGVDTLSGDASGASGAWLMTSSMTSSTVPMMSSSTINVGTGVDRAPVAEGKEDEDDEEPVITDNVDVEVHVT